MNKWLTLREAAAHVRLGERAFRQAVNAGRYPPGRHAALGRKKLWLATELDDALMGAKDAPGTDDPIMAAFHASQAQPAQIRPPRPR